tara:strand:- start:19143 stop:20096 length:954 start_codon:yes stop_codon:yes gene_type:complete
MIKKYFFKDFEKTEWDLFLSKNYTDNLLFSYDIIRYEQEYYKSINESYYIKHLDEIALVKIYKSEAKTYFSQIFFSDKTTYNLNILKNISKQVLIDLNNSEELMCLKEYCHSEKSDVFYSYLRESFLLNPIFELWADITKSKSELWGNLRSSYRNLIKKNHDKFEIKFPENFNIDLYKQLHYEVSGRITRSNLTWEYQERMFNDRKLIVCEAYYEKNLTSYSFFNLNNKTAQYSISVSQRELQSKLPSAHIIIWESILKLKSLGIHDFYIGFGRDLNKPKTKVDKIFLFKSGFTNKLKKSILIEKENDEFFQTGVFK